MYEGRQYRLVEALTTAELKNASTVLHDLAQKLRPSIMRSAAAHELTELRKALTNMVRANRILLDEEAILPKGVSGNSARIFALATDAADEVDVLSDILKRIADNIGVWALKIDKHVLDQESKHALDPGTQLKPQQESKQFGHLW
jgi:hypothetical protein